MPILKRLSFLCFGALIFASGAFAQTNISYTTTGVLQAISGADKLGLSGKTLTVSNTLSSSATPIAGTNNQYATTVSITVAGNPFVNNLMASAIVTINFVGTNSPNNSIAVTIPSVTIPLAGTLSIASDILVPSVSSLQPAPIAPTSLTPADTLTISNGSDSTTYEFISGTIISDPAINICTYSVTPPTLSFPAEGGTAALDITVTSGSDCIWSATSSSTWLSVSPASGTGTTTVLLTAEPNPTTSTQTGTIEVGGQIVTVTEAGSTACAFTVTPSAVTFPSTGGSNLFTVTQTAGTVCDWSARTTLPWVALDPLGGDGSGTLTATVQPNSSGNTLTGTINIAGQDIPVAQPSIGGPCTYTVTPTSINFLATGGTGTVSVSTTAPTCAWTASSPVGWVALSTTSASGTQDVTLTLTPNTGAPRSTTLTIAGQSVTINESDTATCTFDVTSNPSPLTFPSTGGEATINIVAGGPSCTWDVSVTPTWVTPSAPSGVGTQTITIFVPINSGSQRTGNLTVAGITLPVTQDAPVGCTFAVAPGTINFPTSGGTQTVSITASDPSCSWKVTGGATWVTATPSSGAGSGVVTLTAAPNATTTNFTTAFTIANQDVTVTESPIGCTFVVDPTVISFPGSGSTVTLTITASNGNCAWTTTSTVPWLTVAPATGLGNGIATLSAQANPTGTPLSGAITVAGQVLSVSEAAGAGCTFAVSPGALTFTNGGGSAVKSISTNAQNCAWTATAPSFVQLSATSGTGDASLLITAADNENGGVESGTVVIAGVSFPVTVSGGCVFTVNPTSIAVDAKAQTVNVNVTANPTTCTWTASGPSFTALSTNSGTGNGSVGVTFLPNTTGANLTGSLLVAGLTVPITQAFTTQTFQDVAPSAYYFNAVNLLAQAGVTTGCGNNDFCPDQNLSRVEMAILIVKAIFGNNPLPAPPNQIFNDVPPGSFGYAQVQAFSLLGITNGCGNNNFCPNETVTRDQAAVFFDKARLGSSTIYPIPVTQLFTDVPPTYWAYGPIQRFAADGITSGCAPSLYCPTEAVTRAQAAVFIVKALFNELLPTGTPIISSASPTVLVPGTTQTISLTGLNTSWSQGSTGLLNSIPGMIIDAINVTSYTSMSVTITTPPSLAAIPYSIVVVENGTELDVLPNGLTVQ